MAIHFPSFLAKFCKNGPINNNGHFARKPKLIGGEPSKLSEYQPGFADQVDHTMIIYGAIQIIQIFFNDLTMIDLESSMVQSMVSREP